MENHSFEFTYSGKETEEVRKIREKYLPKSEDNLEKLRRLDKSAAKKGTIWSLVIGILGTLIMGGGMSMCMVWTDTLLLPGIIVGIAGIAMLSLAYPVYKTVTEKERQRIAPEILRLSDELLK